LKKDGDTCWVAPGSSRCWAVSSTDLAPVMLALDARIRLASKDGDRTIQASQMYNNDGVNYLAKRPGEIVTAVEIPPAHGDISAFQKLRRRGSIDFQFSTLPSGFAPPPQGRPLRRRASR
jgi:4-hydroxybenzoyl-CoA reductase subunit beta